MEHSNQLYLGGEWKKGGGAEITSVFPADESVNAHVSGASLQDVEHAIARAQDAQPSWAALKPHERANHLHAISLGISARLDEISQVQTMDTGKNLRETRALAMSAAGTFRYFAAVCETMEDAVTPQRGDALTLSLHESLGVVAGITPWNSPIASDAQKIAPALAAGNAIVLKPSSWSPLVSLILAKIIDEAGLPKGLFSTLHGGGAEIGDAIVKHEAIKKVSFTGGNAVGKHIAHLAADKYMPISLELGGKSPTIVYNDCDIEQALAGILFGIFSSTGQSCIAGSRLFVEKGIYPEFMRRLLSATKALKVGHPHDATTQVAPLIRAPHLKSVEGYITLAKAEGGRVLAGGNRPHNKGYYLNPTIIEGVSNDAKVAHEEIFGPVLLVFPFETEEDLLIQANDNQYGLACGIWTSDFNKAYRVARAIKAGTVWVNCYKQFSISTPFGGYKASGLGREKGLQGLRAWQQQKSIYIDVSGQAFPWGAQTVRDNP